MDLARLSGGLRYHARTLVVVVGSGSLALKLAHLSEGRGSNNKGMKRMVFLRSGVTNTVGRIGKQLMLEPIRPELKLV